MSDKRNGPRRTRTESPIAKARIAAGMTQAQLARETGVKPQQIGSWERGERNPKIDAIKRMAAAIGCRTDDLV